MQSGLQPTYFLTFELKFHWNKSVVYQNVQVSLMGPILKIFKRLKCYSSQK